MSKIYYYMQHLMGVGHVFRSMRIAQALVRQGYEVDFVYGGEPIPNFELPGGTVHYLPPLRGGSVVFKDMEMPDGRVADDAYRQKRTEQILQILKDTKPDIVLTETFPLGRRQMRFELLPLLEAIKASGRPIKVLSSIRDILQENWKPSRYDEACDYVNEFYDHVLVHGDRNLVGLEESFPPYDQIKAKLVYTGIVAPDQNASENAPEKCDVVVSVGGGVMGKELLLNALEAKRLSSLSNSNWLIAHGVNMDAETIEHLKSGLDANTHLVPFVHNLRGVMQNAKLSISRCGYNTVADIFTSRTRSIVVPLSDGTETEQLRRGEVLKKKGLSGVVHPDAMTPAVLAAEIDRVMNLPIPDRSGYDLDGAEKSASLIGLIACGSTLPAETLAQ
ncbi:MAG: glycosyltransferase [Salaquimonas sp.]